MTRTQSKALMVLTLACLSGLLMASFREGRQREVLIGHYHCGADTEGATAYLSFEGSGDVLPNRPYVYDNGVTLAESPAETCEQEAAAAHAVVVSLRCTVSAISTQPHEDGGSSSDFDFLCRSTRNGVIYGLAGVVGHLLGIEAP